MGAFFTNLQVRSRAVGDIVGALCANAEARGMDLVEAEPSAAAIDRTVLVLPPDDAGWVAVYDERTEGQDGTSLDAIGTAISAATSAPAIGVTVHDSDVLELRLYVRGERIDRYDSYPGYFGEPVEAASSDPERWRVVADPDALRDAWSSERARSADDVLARTCRLLAIDVPRASLGYAYASSEFGRELPEGTVVLRFRSRERPPWETASTDRPALVAESYFDGLLELAVGDEVRVSLGARSTGRASTGVEVRLWGSALDLVAIERVVLLVGNVREGAPFTELIAEPTRTLDGAPMWVASRPEQPIPAGSAEPFAAFEPEMDMHRALDAMMRAKVHVNVVGRAIAQGEGELGIGLVPLERPLDGAAGTIARIAIGPTIEAPLRARLAELGATSQVLRPLLGRRYLVAMVAIDAPRAVLARRAGEALACARDAIGDEDRVHTTIFFGDARRPEARAGQAKTALAADELDRLFAAIESEPLVTIEAGPIAIWAGTGVLRSDEARVPWLFASFDTEGGRDASATHAAWSAMLDEIVAADGLQATMLYSGWSALAAGESTPYEQVCGLVHGIAMRRAWVARWIRVPTNDRLWLGRSLAPRVDRARLADLADVDVLEGGAIRVTLRDSVRARELEDVLAELLPSFEDAIAALHA